jgi:hypothetical protein
MHIYLFDMILYKNTYSVLPNRRVQEDRLSLLAPAYHLQVPIHILLDRGGTTLLHSISLILVRRNGNEKYGISMRIELVEYIGR